MVATRNYTPAPPPSDAGGDDLARAIDEMIEARLLPYMNRIGTISSISGGNAQVAVQGWDEESSGQQLRARLAGTNFAVGDTVLMTPVARGEYVVAGKIANSTADRAVVGETELQVNAVRQRHIGGGEITPAKLDRAYATPGDVTNVANERAGVIFDARITPYATTTALTNAIATRQPVGNYPTTGQMNQALAGKADTVHAHWTNQIFFQANNAGLTGAMVALKAMIICTYQNRNKAGNPCGSRLDQLDQIRF